MLGLIYPDEKVTSHLSGTSYLKNLFPNYGKIFGMTTHMQELQMGVFQYLFILIH